VGLYIHLYPLIHGAVFSLAYGQFTFYMYIYMKRYTFRDTEG